MFRDINFITQCMHGDYYIIDMRQLGNVLLLTCLRYRAICDRKEFRYYASCWIASHSCLYVLSMLARAQRKTAMQSNFVGCDIRSCRQKIDEEINYLFAGSKTDATEKPQTCVHVIFAICNIPVISRIIDISFRRFFINPLFNYFMLR